MIVLVGPDRCGKTSVALAVQQLAPDMYYYHHTKPPMDAFLYFARYFMVANPWAVVDRCHWCEVAYGRTYRDGSSMSDHEFRILEMALLTHRATVIYVYDDVESIGSRWSDDEMYKFDAEKQARLMAEYLEVYHESPVKKVMYKMTDLVQNGKPTSILSEIVSNSCQDTVNSPSHRFNRPPSIGIGSTRGGVLIIGEAPGNHWSGHIPVPLSFGYSGTFLWEALESIKCDWSDVHIVNASTFTPYSLRAFCKCYDFDRVVTLGKPAAALAKCLDTPVYELDHPHYVKRFKSNKKSLWENELKAAIYG